MELTSNTAANLGHEIFGLQRAVRRIVAASQRAEETGVALQFVLRFVSEGDSRAARLAERLGVGAPVLSRYIAELEEQGYVFRRKDPSDGRARLVALTSLGADKLRHIDERRAAALMECLGAWSEEDAGNTARILQTLNETLAASGRTIETGRPQREP
ncbi:ArsR family transcriptional regulator [Pseudarthrobacter sulfonivorans]|uniref:ArsR family transcriptional regulator n=1 Tax=Pseudarthrobacter sulfonivorans TaxID=121292 RepID=A0A0U3Q9J6_9MICC|nr:MarR family transcriptional regulator [Pseudarthrobacter sulfonivorans]ALV41882.1 ArsR family transcriptional regulator [Pseudarthrobacter sulfonivorans]